MILSPCDREEETTEREKGQSKREEKRILTEASV
jgi:hypothetical protein